MKLDEGENCSKNRIGLLRRTAMTLKVLALVGFQGRGCADGVQPDLCRSLLLEALICQ
jgi:hypothetical protein